MDSDFYAILVRKIEEAITICDRFSEDGDITLEVKEQLESCRQKLVEFY